MTTIQYGRALDDIAAGTIRWRVWLLLGFGDIRQRYARSKIGQFWITLSMAMFIGAIGAVYPVIFNQPPSVYLPYLATNFVVWTLLAGVVTDSSNIYFSSEALLRQETMPKTIFIMRMLFKNAIVFLHNIVVVPIVFLYFGIAPSWTWALVPVGLGIVLLAGFFAGLFLGVACTRFRDLPQIVQNVMQLAFFVTPVTWPESAVQQHAPALVAYNPAAVFVRLVAEPMRGSVPAATDYAVAGLVVVVLACVSVPVFARYRARIVYWL